MSCRAILPPGGRHCRCRSSAARSPPCASAAGDAGAPGRPRGEDRLTDVDSPGWRRPGGGPSRSLGSRGLVPRVREVGDPRFGQGSLARTHRLREVWLMTGPVWDRAARSSHRHHEGASARRAGSRSCPPRALLPPAAPGGVQAVCWWQPCPGGPPASGGQVKDTACAKSGRRAWAGALGALGRELVTRCSRGAGGPRPGGAGGTRPAAPSSGRTLHALGRSSSLSLARSLPRSAPPPQTWWASGVLPTAAAGTGEQFGGAPGSGLQPPGQPGAGTRPSEPGPQATKGRGSWNSQA